LSTQDAALLAASIWSGLLTNSYYYKKFDRMRAHVLFRQTLLILAGLTGQHSISSNDKQTAEEMLHTIHEIE
jgi:hypothetical protein